MNYGEVIDRYSIQYIKKCNKDNVIVNPEAPLELILNLLSTNMKLWNLEDEIRDTKNSLVQAGIIGRQISITNDERCELKNKLNELIGIDLKEIKLYKKI